MQKTQEISSVLGYGVLPAENLIRDAWIRFGVAILYT
jgi:hypothetical protein